MCDIYGDLLELCRGARNVFIDKLGGQGRECPIDCRSQIYSDNLSDRLGILPGLVEGYVGTVRIGIRRYRPSL